MKKEKEKVTRIDQNHVIAKKYYPVVIIGAGESGIAMGCQLKKVLKCTDFRVFERRGGIGGVWYTNRYPGVACDIPAICYSYSFFTKKDWTALMPTGQEVREYLVSACKHFGIHDKIELNTEITSLRWLEDEAQWELTVSHLASGVGDMSTAERKAAIESRGLQNVVLEVEVIRARVVVSAVGGLVEPKGIPEIPGKDSFKGHILHTARWDEAVEIEGKDIVVVGTGATGAQITPALIERGAKSVTQVMRSPPWVTPGMTPEAAAGWAKWMPSLCAYVPGLQWSLRKIIFTQFEMEFSALFKATESSRKKRQKKGKELVDYLNTATPEQYHEILTPSYEVFCKRRVMDTAWFRSLHSDNVDLTTLALTKIEEKTVMLAQNDSIETKVVPADIIVFANGYETGKWLHPIEVIGKGARSLSQTWKDRGGPQAYLGTAVDGFPNFFMIAGPNTFSGHSSVILASENSVAYVLKMIRPILQGDVKAVEVKEAAERQYTLEVQETLKKSVWMSGGCSSYYFTADGWNSFLYPRSQIDFYRRCHYPRYNDWNATYTEHGWLKYRLRLGVKRPDPVSLQAAENDLPGLNEKSSGTALSSVAVSSETAIDDSAVDYDTETRSGAINYPSPREAASMEEWKDASNPALRGLPLSAAASILSSSKRMQNIFWHNAGFDKVRKIDELSGYLPRFDPSVYVTSKSVALAHDDAPTSLPVKQNASYYTAADFHKLYVSKQLTPTAVVNALLPLIRRDTEPVGKHAIAFLESKASAINAAAHLSTQRYAEGKDLGILDGVPFAVMDEIDVAGYRKTLGTKFDFSSKETVTAACVCELEAYGAINMGKLNMHELGLDASNNNPIKGTPLNPYNTSMYAGGAAGGAGYAVATGLIPIAIGVDDGGSIRVPAGFCGAYSLKPTHGRVLEKHSTVLSPSLAVYGPVASSIDDLHLSFQIMTRSFSSESSKPSIPSIPSAICSYPGRSKVLGICSPWVERADLLVRLAFKRTVEHYTQNCGYRVVEISLPQLPLGQTAHALTLLSEVRSSLTREVRRGLTPPSRVVLGVSAPASADDYIAAQRLRNLLMQHLSWLWHQHPQMIILTPVSPLQSWRVSKPSQDLGKRGVSDSDQGLRCMEYTWLANFTGIPAVTRPVAYADVTGVPISVMAMGEWGSEDSLFSWAREGEDILDQTGGLRRPPTWVDAVESALNMVLPAISI